MDSTRVKPLPIRFMPLASPSWDAQFIALGRALDRLRTLKREEEHVLILPSTSSSGLLYRTALRASVESMKENGYLFRWDRPLKDEMIVVDLRDDQSGRVVVEKRARVIAGRRLDVTQAILYMVGELIDNISDHARSSFGVVGLAKYAQRFSCIVADTGVGIAGGYRAAGVHVRDDCSALRSALRGISAKTVEERGTGLPSIQRLVRDIFAGELHLISLGAHLQSHPKGILCKASRVYWQGTIVAFTGTIPRKTIAFYEALS